MYIHWNGKSEPTATRAPYIGSLRMVSVLNKPQLGGGVGGAPTGKGLPLYRISIFLGMALHIR